MSEWKKKFPTCPKCGIILGGGNWAYSKILLYCENEKCDVYGYEIPVKREEIVYYDHADIEKNIVFDVPDEAYTTNERQLDNLLDYRTEQVAPAIQIKLKVLEDKNE